MPLGQFKTSSGDTVASGADNDLASELSLEGRLEKLRRIKIQRRLFGIALVLSDGFALVLAVLLSQAAIGSSTSLADDVAILAFFYPIFVLTALQTGAYSPTIAHKPSASIQKAIGTFAIAAAIFFSMLFFTKLGASISRLLVGETMVICFLFGVAGRYAIAMRARKVLSAKPFADLCIYDDVPKSSASGAGAIAAAQAGLGPDLASPEAIGRLGDLARGMDRLVIHCSPARREDWSHALKCVDIRSEIVMPELTALMPLSVRYRGDNVSLVLANGPLPWHQQVVKKVFDRLFAIAALILAGPAMLLIALAIKLDSRGPVFFRQDRIGLGNRRFGIWKFRTMKAEATDQAGIRSVTHEDDRVTRVGRFLRRTSLDELPQFFNVLAGQMSVVGPRPHAIGSSAENAYFWDIDERYWYRHSISPGMTGLAQIRGLRGATHKRGDLERRLHADLEYAANWSLVGDIRIIFQTFFVLIHRNAY